MRRFGRCRGVCGHFLRVSWLQKTCQTRSIPPWRPIEAQEAPCRLGQVSFPQLRAKELGPGELLLTVNAFISTSYGPMWAKGVCNSLVLGVYGVSSP